MKNFSIIRFAAVSAIGALILDIIIIFLLGFITPGYDPIKQYISELGSVFSPYASLINIWWQLYSLPLMLFAYGLYRGIHRSKISWLAPTTIAIESLFNGVFAGFFSCDLGCTGNSFSNTMHLWFSGIGVGISVFIPFILLISVQKDKRWSGLKNFLVVIQILLFIVSFIFFYQEYLSMFFNKSYNAGLFQRTYMVVYYTALLIPAIHLYKIKNVSNRKFTNK